MPEEMPSSSPTPQEMEVARKWLQKWNKGGAPDDQVQTVVRAVAEGADKTRDALAGVGVILKPGKVKEFNARIFPALAASMAALRPAIIATVEQGIATATASPAIHSRERVEGPGFPMGDLIIEPGVRASEEEVRALLDALDLDGIYNTCIAMTGMEPPRHALNIRMFHGPEQKTQASVNADRIYRTRFYPEHRRTRLEMVDSQPTSTLSINHNFAHKDPEEARGVIYHEFGHHWTQKSLTASHGNVAFTEGIGELMRIAAARREGAGWKQLTTRPLQFLDGRPCPGVAAANFVECDERLSFIAKTVASQRLIAHLQGLDERKIAGIARACTYTGPDRTSPTLRQLIADIERETGVAGFVERCLADEILTPGNLRTGEMAFASMNDAGNRYVIMRFNVPNNGGHFGWSVQEHMTLRNDMTAADFHMQPINTAPLLFGVDFQKPNGEIAFGITTDGSFEVTPEFILKQARAGRMQWPTGDTRIYYRIGTQRILLEHPLRITEEDLTRRAL